MRCIQQIIDKKAISNRDFDKAIKFGDMITDSIESEIGETAYRKHHKLVDDFVNELTWVMYSTDSKDTA